MRDEAVTPRVCPACGMSDAPSRADCRLCKGSGLVSATTWAQFKDRGRVRASSTTMSVAKNAEVLIAKLKDRGTPTGLGLAIRGERLLQKIDGWQLEPADGGTRAKVYMQVADWQREACEYLANGE